MHGTCYNGYFIYQKFLSTEARTIRMNALIISFDGLLLEQRAPYIGITINLFRAGANRMSHLEMYSFSSVVILGPNKLSYSLCIP